MAGDGQMGMYWYSVPFRHLGSVFCSHQQPAVPTRDMRKKNDCMSANHDHYKLLVPPVSKWHRAIKNHGVNPGASAATDNRAACKK